MSNLTGTSNEPASARAARFLSRSSSTAIPWRNQEIEADGNFQDLEFEIPHRALKLGRASDLPNSQHTNPVFVTVGDKPIRASKRSAQWCLESVDQCWKQKQNAIRPSERDEARAAYDLAQRPTARSATNRPWIEQGA